MQNNFLELPLVGDGEYHFRESIKTLRTNIRLNKNNIKKIMITSTSFREGKTVISAEFAASLGSIGKKVLLMDADLRGSNNSRNVKAGMKGLVDYLRGRARPDEIVYKTDVKNVDLLYAGVPVQNSSELLDGESLKELMELLSGEYDYLIVDTPPIGCVIDAAVIAASCDGIVLVIESGKSGYKSVRAALNQLKLTGCEILGAVLNKSENASKDGNSKSNLLAVHG